MPGLLGVTHSVLLKSLSLSEIFGLLQMIESRGKQYCFSVCIPVFPLLRVRVAAGFLCTKRRFVHCVHTLLLALVCKAHLQFFLANKLWIIIVDTKPPFSQAASIHV